MLLEAPNPDPNPNPTCSRIGFSLRLRHPRNAIFRSPEMASWTAQAHQLAQQRLQEAVMHNVPGLSGVCDVCGVCTRIVKNVVMYDALNILDHVGCLNQRAHAAA